MSISLINSYNQISFTSQKKSKKVVKVPCKTRKKLETDNSIQKAEQQKQYKPNETLYPYTYKRSKKEKFMDNLAGITYIALLIAIPPLVVMGESNNKKEHESQPTHPYSSTYQYEGTIPSETAPIILETAPNEVFEIVSEETSAMPEEIAPKNNTAQQITYDKNGTIIEIIEYDEEGYNTKITYSYSENLKIENVKYLNARQNQINEVITIYDVNDNIVSKEFKSNNNIVGTFDFSSDMVTIGSEKNTKLRYSVTLKSFMPKKGEVTCIYKLDSDSFKYDESAFGSNKYTAMLDGFKVAFDVLKDGICVKYLDDNDNIIKSEMYNTNAELVK